MSKEEVLEFEGVVTEVLPDSRFRVKLENDHEIIAYTAGKMKKFRIRTIAGDRVTVEMTTRTVRAHRLPVAGIRAAGLAAADGADRLAVCV